MIQVGIIGAGAMGTHHAETVVAALAGRARLAAIAEIEPALRDRCTTRFRCTGYADYEELLADRAIDAVCICLPHHLHAECAVKAAAAGKHLLVEKPLAITLDECDQIIAAAHAAGVVLMVGHLMRFVPSFIVAREILSAGTVGVPILATSTNSKAWTLERRRVWHTDRSRGGGMWLTCGVHLLDRLTWLVGSDVVAVKAMIDTRLHAQAADDVGLVHLEYANGVHGAVIAVGYANGAPENLDEVTCTGGMLNCGLGGVWIGRDEAWQEIDWRTRWSAAEWRPPAQIGEWMAFLDAVSGVCPPAVTGEYARSLVEVLLAAEQSASGGREVRLAHPVITASH